MKNKNLILAIVISLAIGFFIGQEYTKYTIRQSFSEVFSDSSPSTEDSDSGEIRKEVEKMNSIDVAVGDVVELATRSYVINSIEEKDMIKSKYSQPHLATEGTKFVVVNMTATNTTSETYDFTDDGIRLESSEGDFYETYSETISNVDNYLSYKEMSPNIPITGVVVFQLPNSAESYDLIVAKANSNDLYRVKLK